jgi:hypothetical protein
VQVPSVPASAHDLQVAVQVVEQQNPWAQTLLEQSVPAVQVAPFARFVQAPVVQTLGLTQSASTVHEVLQAPVPQVKGSQGDVATVRQVPVPLQVRAGVSVEPVQVAAAHDEPAAYRRQAPAPLQSPSVLQVAAPASAHWPSGSWPAGTLVQVPSEPAIAHDWQVPAQAVPQQMF